jgi:hypothetical protein
MKDLDKGIPDLSKLCSRQGPKDIYKKDLAPDHVDNLKVAETHKKLVSKKK